jgi:hypothetical protein
MRENVNRYLREWQRRGILQLKDRWIIILNLEALHAIEESYGQWVASASLLAALPIKSARPHRGAAAPAAAL